MVPKLINLPKDASDFCKLTKGCIRNAKARSVGVLPCYVQFLCLFIYTCVQPKLRASRKNSLFFSLFSAATFDCTRHS